MQQSGHTLQRWAVQNGFAPSIRSTVNRSQAIRHCDFGAAVRFASIFTHCILSLGEIPRISSRKRIRFDWLKSAHIERISFDSKGLRVLTQGRIKAPISV